MVVINLADVPRRLAQRIALASKRKKTIGKHEIEEIVAKIARIPPASVSHDDRSKLQTLERDGFVNRTVLQSIPPKVEYSLTDLGREVAQRLMAVIELVEGHLPDVEQARERYDSR